MIGPARERIEFLRARTSTAKRVTGPAPERVTATLQGDAEFTRILVGYSTGETIFVSMAAEARESGAVSPRRARPAVRMEMVSRPAPAELQERWALRE